MTDAEAKELLIASMDYAAYRETDNSLWPSDKKKLFGEYHYPEKPDDGPSVWGSGEEFEAKMAFFLRWAIKLGTAKGNYKNAIRHLLTGKHYINEIIRRARLDDV